MNYWKYKVINNIEIDGVVVVPAGETIYVMSTDEIAKQVDSGNVEIITE